MIDSGGSAGVVQVGEGFLPAAPQRGWKSWPPAVRVGIVGFLVFAVLVIVTKALHFFG